MELVVAPKEGNWTRFWSVQDISYDQGCIIISGHVYRDDELCDDYVRKLFDDIEHIRIILDNEKMPEKFRKQLADVFWSSNDDGHVLDIKVETHKTIVQTESLLDWAKVN